MRRAVRAHAHARCTVTPADAAVIDPRHLGSTAALAGRLVLVLARLDDDGVGLLARVQLVIRELRRLDAERRPFERARQRDVVPVLAGRLPHARRGLPLERLRLAHQTRPMLRPPRRARPAPFSRRVSSACGRLRPFLSSLLPPRSPARPPPAPPLPALAGVFFAPR